MGSISTSFVGSQKDKRLVSRDDLLPVGILVAAVLIFFLPVILGNAWIPAGGGDLVSFIYPNYRFAAKSLHSGELPLWNPFLYAGAPFITDNQSGVFYPVNLLLFLINPEFSYRAIENLVILHILFAGIAMYFCLRWYRSEVPIKRAAAVFGGLAFMFSGVLLTHLGNLNLVAVLAWLPLIFVCLHRAIVEQSADRRIAWAVAAGVALGTSTLAGHGQMTFLIAGFLGVYALLMTILDREWLALPLLIIVALIGLATAAIALIPAYQSLSQTVRAEFDLAGASAFSLPWQGLTGLFAPDFYGRGIYRFWGSWSRVEYGYLGVLPLLLAGVAVISRPGKRVLMLVVMAVLFILLALGDNTGLYPLLVRIAPIFPFQAPARFILLVDFCLAVLATIGLDALLMGSTSRRQKNIFLIGIGVAFTIVLALLIGQLVSIDNPQPERVSQMRQAILVFSIFSISGGVLIIARYQGWLPPLHFAALAILLLAIDLISLGGYVEVDWNNPTQGFPDHSAALSYLNNDPGIHRVEITGVWQPNLPQVAQLFSIGGVYNPLALSNFTVYEGSVGYRGSPLYNLLGVKYVIAAKDQPPGDTNFLVPVYTDDSLVDIYLNTLALPRVMLMYHSILVPDHDAAFSAVHQDDFNPASSVVLEGGRELSQQHGTGNITISRYDLNEAIFEVTTDSPAYLLLTDIFHPDWQAFVDGKQTPIEVADYTFRAVFLEPGQHNIRFQFAPSGWPAGLVITSLSWLAVVIYAVWYWRLRRPL